MTWSLLSLGIACHKKRLVRTHSTDLDLGPGIARVDQGRERWGGYLDPNRQQLPSEMGDWKTRGSTTEPDKRGQSLGEVGQGFEEGLASQSSLYRLRRSIANTAW